MNFDTKLITDKNELLKYKDKIFNLFKNSFGKNLDSELWYWAYINNINGNPIVSLYFYDENLVGHHAIIPIELKLNERNILAGLSMTTMVDLAYRKHGIFIKQAEEVYEKANALNYDLVFGFPNNNSTPGFKKRLGWIIDESSYVAKLSKHELLTLRSKETNCISINQQNSQFMKWRLSKPQQKYQRIDSLVVKNFEDSIDILIHENNFDQLDDNRQYNILISDNENFIDKKVFNYTFGYRLFNKNIRNICFKKDLLMSDVF